MEVTLAPTLSGLQKSLLRNWLIRVLNDPELNSSVSFPLSRYLSIYVDKRPAILRSGSWMMASESIYLAGEDRNCPTSERLPILLTLSQLCEPSEELTKACSGAITRYLLGEYRSLSSNLVVSSVQPSGIAFSCDNRVASLFGGEWMLSSGEPVDVSGPDWVVCASEVPATTTESVENFDNLGVGTGGETIDDPPPINSEYQFSVGQRVHWTPCEDDARDGIEECDAVIIDLPNGEDGAYYIREDNGPNWWARTEELRAI